MCSEFGGPNLGSHGSSAFGGGALLGGGPLKPGGGGLHFGFGGHGGSAFLVAILSVDGPSHFLSFPSCLSPE